MRADKVTDKMPQKPDVVDVDAKDDKKKKKEINVSGME